MQPSYADIWLQLDLGLQRLMTTNDRRMDDGPCLSFKLHKRKTFITLPFPDGSGINHSDRFLSFWRLSLRPRHQTLPKLQNQVISLKALEFESNVLLFLSRDLTKQKTAKQKRNLYKTFLKLHQEVEIYVLNLQLLVRDQHQRTCQRTSIMRTRHCLCENTFFKEYMVTIYEKLNQ